MLIICFPTTVSVLGYYLPFLLAGGAISAVAYGLLSTLSSSTSAAKWIGYQILYGVASGCTAAAVSFVHRKAWFHSLITPSL